MNEANLVLYRGPAVCLSPQNDILATGRVEFDTTGVSGFFFPDEDHAVNKGPLVAKLKTEHGVHPVRYIELRTIGIGRPCFRFS